ncbi:hypothetical protein [Mitsuaria sp. GD03876]|uniref:hypothetical protein n=1 Tax=Mitsuaria sp. GD03876 TaxID=2975399 RepID=UPI00244CB6AC|nr:hypothetical protein [Mitsuaria sp. GD03876]MDH0868069.1 hypothetical protein [Mitsuaria sp. GD03876]
MDHVSLSIALNSGIATVLATKYCEHLSSRAGLWKLVAFITAIFMANMALMLDRFALEEAAMRASSIAVGFIAYVFVMATIHARRRERQKTSR